MVLSLWDDEYNLYAADKVDNETVDDAAYGVCKTTGQVRELYGE